MVFKVCKGGVRSGNTLRGLHTRKAYSYGRHGCLIGRSSMTSRDVTKMVDASTDDSMVAKTVQSTDVILSLNKKQRWDIPATMRHMIKSGYFGPSAMVSLLERHKLKRRANCVSFISNKKKFGKFLSVKPKQKRYFSYNLNNSDEDESKRQKRKKIAIEKRKLKKPKEKKKAQPLTVIAYTMNGPEFDEQGQATNTVIQSTKPEYRMEVFYPCPKTCSLAFNPKYTDVMIDTNEEGNQVVKAVKKQGQPKSKRRHHRQRYTKSAWENTYADELEDDLNEMWSEVYEEQSQSQTHSAEDEASTKSVGVSTNAEACDDLWSELIVQAEQAKEWCLLSAPTHQIRSSSNRSKSSGSCSEDNSKHHIVYLEGTDDFANKRTKKTVPSSSKSQTHYTDTTCFRVIVSDTEVYPEQLTAKFGQAYSEADCEPRRFIINVTEQVRNIFGDTRCSVTKAENVSYTSYLVFKYDGIFSEGLDAYQVMFNSYVYSGDIQFHKARGNIQDKQYSIDEIINRTFEFLLEQYYKSSYKASCLINVPKRETNKGTYNGSNNEVLDVLHDKLNVKIQSFFTDHEISNVCLTDIGSTSFSSKLTKLVSDQEFGQFCQICYDDVSHGQSGSVPGTSLNKCCHMFCDTCWKIHIRTKCEDGATVLTCPGYDCDVTVGPVTLISLVHATEVGLLLQRQREEEMDKSEDTKWCPNPACGRVIKMEAKTSTSAQDTSFDVHCPCGVNICFACFGDAHWPASCDQAQQYSDRLADIKVPDEAERDPSEKVIPVDPETNRYKKKPEVLNVQGGICPRCKRFLVKSGGCRSMVCKCGLNFCWDCMTPWAQHKAKCVHVQDVVREMVVRHIDLIPQPLRPLEGATASTSADTASAATTIPKGKSRASLYQRAKQQREEIVRSPPCWKTIDALANKIATIASKDQGFKEEILQLCCSHHQSATSSLKCHVTRLLTSCWQTRQSLHHVAEFTFVLLQTTPPHSQDRRRAMALASDISAYCSFLRSILEGGDQQQQLRTVVRRLVDIQGWARRALVTLVKTVRALRSQQ